jgi:hypothetical protein
MKSTPWTCTGLSRHLSPRLEERGFTGCGKTRPVCHSEESGRRGTTRNLASRVRPEHDSSLRFVESVHFNAKPFLQHVDNLDPYGLPISLVS